MLVRAAWLVSFVLAGELAHRLTAGRPRALRGVAAAAFAVVVLALLFDDVTAWSRQVAGGMSEPLLVALVLGAVRSAARRPRRARRSCLGALAALVRPEAWLLLVAYAAWTWARGQNARARPVAVAVVLARARAVARARPARGRRRGRASARSAARAIRPRRCGGRRCCRSRSPGRWRCSPRCSDRRASRVLAAGALAWIALVAAMTLLGFPGLPRFVAPAAAIVGVLGGVGLAALFARPRENGAVVPAAVALALVLSVALLPHRIGAVPDAWRAAARISDSHDRLRAAVRDGRRSRAAAALRSSGDERRARAHRAGLGARRGALARRELRRAVAALRRVRRRAAGLAGPAPRDARRGPPRRASRTSGACCSVGCPLTATASSSARSAGVVGRDAVGLHGRARLLVVLAVGVDGPEVVRAPAHAFSTARSAVSIEWSELL